ncbi:MAG: hypothetical protein E7532_05545 [Ruminococcaceae bacterium]|nr:hypothetical protein [Oscillospiraceae bacterium]
MKKNTIIISPADSNILSYFEKDYEIIQSDYLKDYISYERYHADLQAVRINDRLFINDKCKIIIEKLNESEIKYTLCENISAAYPDNVALNAALVGNNLICNNKALHPKVKSYCEKTGINIIDTKQGYANCSTLTVDDNSIITDDKSIARVAIKHGIDVLEIEKGDIYLDGKAEGFIGGASAKIGDCIYFFGDINTHRNKDEIISFINSKSTKFINISNSNLVDLGGLVIIG